MASFSQTAGGQWIKLVKPNKDGKFTKRQMKDLFNALVERADANKDGVLDVAEMTAMMSDKKMFADAAADVAARAANNAADEEYFMGTQANKQPGAEDWCMKNYDDIANNSAFLSSKVGMEQYAVDSLVSMLECGNYKIGSGKTRARLAALNFDFGKLVLGAGKVVSDSHFLMHNKFLHGGKCKTKPCSCYRCWLEVYAHYSGLTKFGVVILCGTLHQFRVWSQSAACREEVKLVGKGRLFAFVAGYLLSVDIHDNRASASVQDGEGVIVYGNGNSYEGGIKGCVQHGRGTLTWADGAVYTGAWEAGKMHGQGTHTWAVGSVYTGAYEAGKRHGQGTQTWADGRVYTGAWEAGEEHGQGKMTLANGTVQEGRFENRNFKG